MKTLLKILKYFFTTLGVIFFIIILLGIYLFVADPFGWKPLLSLFIPSSDQSSATAPIDTSAPIKTTPTKTSTTATKTLLTPTQTKQLEALGVNTANLPTEMTPELQTCLTEKLGAARADELLKGSAPTPVDLLKAGSCLKK